MRLPKSSYEFLIDQGGQFEMLVKVVELDHSDPRVRDDFDLENPKVRDLDVCIRSVGGKRYLEVTMPRGVDRRFVIEECAKYAVSAGIRPPATETVSYLPGSGHYILGKSHTLVVSLDGHTGPSSSARVKSAIDEGAKEVEACLPCSFWSQYVRDELIERVVRSAVSELEKKTMASYLSNGVLAEACRLAGVAVGSGRKLKAYDQMGQARFDEVAGAFCTQLKTGLMLRPEFAYPNETSYLPGSIHYIAGEAYVVRVVVRDCAGNENPYSADNGVLTVSVSLSLVPSLINNPLYDDQVKKALRDCSICMMKRSLHEGGILEVCEKYFSAQLTELRADRLDSCWGWIRPRKKEMCLCETLGKYTETSLLHVVVHEFCHVAFPAQHNKGFYDLFLEKYPRIAEELNRRGLHVETNWEKAAMMI